MIAQRSGRAQLHSQNKRPVVLTFLQGVRIAEPSQTSVLNGTFFLFFLYFFLRFLFYLISLYAPKQLLSIPVSFLFSLVLQFCSCTFLYFFSFFPLFLFPSLAYFQFFRDRYVLHFSFSFLPSLMRFYSLLFDMSSLPREIKCGWSDDTAYTSIGKLWIRWHLEDLVFYSLRFVESRTHCRFSYIGIA